MRFSRLIGTIDAHAGGEPLRIVTAGLPPLPGGRCWSAAGRCASATTSCAAC